MKDSERNKQWFWGAVAGAAALSMVTLSWDIWVTRGAAERMAKAHAEAAVAQALAPICVERFRQQENAPARLVELKKFDEYERVTFIEKGGWATPPASVVPHSGAAKVCAEMLSKN